MQAWYDLEWQKWTKDKNPSGLTRLRVMYLSPFFFVQNGDGARWRDRKPDVSAGEIYGLFRWHRCMLTVLSRGAVAVLRDVTEEVRLEKMRRDFVANVSHEIRTPLSMMQGYSEALLDGITVREERRTDPGHS